MGMLQNVQRWLSWHYWASGAGQKLWGALCDEADAVAEQLRAAMRCRLPSVAPADALPEIAWGQNLEPPDVLTLEQTRVYLADPWSKWRVAGTRQRILAECALLGLTSAAIVSWRDLATGGNPGAFGGDSSCWYLQIPQPNPFTPPPNWDAGPPPNFEQDGLDWDAEGLGLIVNLQRIIARWSPAASSCRYIEITLSDTTVVRVPVRWWWEYDATGSAPNYYNDGY